MSVKKELRRRAVWNAKRAFPGLALRGLDARRARAVHRRNPSLWACSCIAPLLVDFATPHGGDRVVSRALARLRPAFAPRHEAFGAGTTMKSDILRSTENGQRDREQISKTFETPIVLANRVYRHRRTPAINLNLLLRTAKNK